jgi:hypothetical protein
VRQPDPARQLSPSPADRARYGLLDDPARSDREIALAVRCRPSTVANVRHRLEALGAITVRTMPVARPPRGPMLPPMPAVLAMGLCATGGYDPDLWTSARRSERELAVAICRAGAVRPVCCQWSLNLPPGDMAVYGGQTATWRAAERRRRAGRPDPAWATVAGKNAARQRRRQQAAAG